MEEHLDQLPTKEAKSACTDYWTLKGNEDLESINPAELQRLLRTLDGANAQATYESSCTELPPTDPWEVACVELGDLLYDGLTEEELERVDDVVAVIKKESGVP